MISEKVKKQREYFNSGATRSYEFRLRALKKLRFAVKENEEKLKKAAKEDFNKPEFETFMCEIAMTLEELDYQIKHLKGFMRDRRVRTPLAQFPAKSVVSYEPYGVVLIMAPWNYPILLCLQPLIGAIAAGNCAVVKPSAYAPHVSGALKELIEEVFDEDFVTVIEGGRRENRALLDEKFDYIFFTGSVAVGKQVMRAAADNLTPLTLELGGKSPVIIDKSANVGLAARKIAFGKILNAGQTCVAPDYVLIHESLQDDFLEEYEKVIDTFFPFGDMHDMPVIVNDKHFERVSSLLKYGYHAIGGGFDEERRFIEPTVLTDVELDSPLMTEEIFGPILPLIPYSELDEAIEFVRERPRPLALYLFTKDRTAEKKVFGKCSFGGGCVNDTIMHLASPYLGFGGVGNSGMGRYHGRKSFETFSNDRSILKKPERDDICVRYHPYSPQKEKLLKLIYK